MLNPLTAGLNARPSKQTNSMCLDATQPPRLRRLSQKKQLLYNLLLILIYIGPFFTYLFWRENPFLHNFEYKSPKLNYSFSHHHEIGEQGPWKNEFLSEKMNHLSTSMELLETEYLPGNDHI